MNIQLSKTAAQYVKKMLNNKDNYSNTSDADGKNNIVGIRLGVKKTGCSGLSYVLDFADASMIGDDKYKQYESEGIVILVNNENHEFLKGTIIDCMGDGLSEYLKFNNPNAQGECGCGESFTV